MDIRIHSTNPIRMSLESSSFFKLVTNAKCRLVVDFTNKALIRAKEKCHAR